MKPSRRPTAPPPIPIRVRHGLPLGIALLVLLCFSPVLHNDFVNWDDDANFLDNPHYRGLSATHLMWMFTTFHWGHYHPLSWAAHALVHAIWGMDPFGYHVISLVVHAATAVVLYFVILALLRDVGGARLGEDSLGTRGAAAVGTLLFAIHPLRVEPVAWATDLHDVLATFFGLLAVLTYLHMVEASVHRAGRSARRWYGLSVGCFALALLSKAAVITLPVVLVVLDVYPLRRLRLGNGAARVRCLLEKLPYAVLATAAAALAMLAKQDRGLVVLTKHGIVARAMQSVYGLCFYLEKTVVPLWLSPLYLLRQPLDTTAPRYLLAAVAVVAITGGVLLLRRRHPWALAAWCCYLLLALPVLGLVQNGPQIAADRYTYLACLPWAVLAAAGLDRVWASARRQQSGATVRAGLAVASAAVLTVLGASTYVQTRVWRDSVTLWTQALAVEPDNFVAYTGRGRARVAAKDIDAALADFDAALRLNPVYVEALISRGNARQQAAAFDAAVADFSAALRVQPLDARTYVNRGNARHLKGDLDGAITDYEAALRIAPHLAAAYYRRGNVRRARGDLAAALADYDECVRLDPTAAQAYNNRAIVREADGDLAGAYADYRAAVRLVPDSGAFQRNVERARQVLDASRR